jgi:hypothetical protein
MLPDALDRMATLSGLHSRDMAGCHVSSRGSDMDCAGPWHDR